MKANTWMRDAWKLPAFLLLGLLLSLAFKAAVGLFPSDYDYKGFLVILAGIPAIFLVAFGFRQVVGHWSELKGTLRWWHGMWFLLYVSALTMQTRGPQDSAADPLNGLALFRVVPESFIFLILLVSLARQRPRWLEYYLKGLVSVLVIFGLACMASTLSSVYWEWTLYKSFEYLLDVSVIATILATIRTTEDYESLFNFTWTLVGIELVWVWCQIGIWPNEALEVPPGAENASVRLAGVFPVMGSNAVGGSGVILATIALSRIFCMRGRESHRSWYILLLAFGLATMVMSETRSAIAGFILAALLIFLASGRASVGVALSFVAAGLLAVTSVGTMVYTYLLRDQTTEQVASLTGRKEWWEYGLHLLSQHPYTGLGAYAASKFAVFPGLGIEGVPSMHSDWMEILVGTSFWGVIPLAVALIWTWKVIVGAMRDHSLTLLERQLVLETLGVLTIITTRSFFNVELCWHAPVLFLVVLGYAEFLRRKKASHPAYVPRPAVYAMSTR
jgi:O-antigen ligase